MKKTMENAVEIIKKGGAIAAGDWTRGGGNYVSKRPVPVGCSEISAKSAGLVLGNAGKAIKKLLRLRPNVRKIIYVSDWRMVNAARKIYDAEHEKIRAANEIESARRLAESQKRCAEYNAKLAAAGGIEAARNWFVSLPESQKKTILGNCQNEFSNGGSSRMCSAFLAQQFLKGNMKMNKTDARAVWLAEHKEEIEAARTEMRNKPRAKGYNAKHVIGMSGGGYGYWERALNRAGIEPNGSNYWHGSAPTPSRAINGGIAKYIDANAPQNLK